jgi:hypothetical protein
MTEFPPDFNPVGRSLNSSRRCQNDNTFPPLFFDSTQGVCYGAEVGKIFHK